MRTFEIQYIGRYIEQKDYCLQTIEASNEVSALTKFAKLFKIDDYNRLLDSNFYWEDGESDWLYSFKCINEVKSKKKIKNKIKNKIDKVMQYIMKNKVIFILFIIYAAFHSFFEDHITKLLVNTFFCHLESTWYNDILVAILCVFAIYSFAKSLKRNSYVPNQILILSFLFCLIIAYYRFCGKTWLFTSTNTFEKIKYIDFLLVFYPLYAFAFVWSYCKRKKYASDKNKGFVFDSPIQTVDDDKLNRNNLAENLAKKISNTVSLEAFAIGICSEWGHGKTSFLNLIKKYLNNNKQIIIQFNPWLNNDENVIVTSFFDELSKILKPYNTELSKDLAEYAAILNVVENNSIEKIFTLLKTNHSKNHLREKFDAINEKIKKTGRQIVIFIDDLDRLYDKEIAEVLRLIRNSANFANTIFVVAYDKNYLISALKKVNEYRPNFYLEKIFQLEIMLPSFEKDVIAEKLKAELDLFLTDEDKKIFEELLKKGDYYGFNYSLFANIRDINRFINSFNLSYEQLEGEIDLLDLLNLELLRVKYLGVYNLFSKNYSNFLEPAMIYGNVKDRYLCLRRLRDPKDKVLEKTEIEAYLEAHYEEVGIQKNQIKDTLEYVGNVFSYCEGAFLTDVNSNILSIASPLSIDRYFYYRLLNSNLSEKEFSKYRQKSEKEFQTQIKKWIEDDIDMIQDIDIRLRQIKFYQNKEDYEKIIKTIFFFASLYTTKDRIIDFSYDNLMSKLTYENVKILYTQDEFEKFIKELLSIQMPPYRFASTFIDEIIYISPPNEWKFELSKEELIKQKFDYFNQYANEIEAIDRNFLCLYFYCSYEERDDTSSSRKEVPPPQEANQILKKHAKRFINSFLENIISRYTTRIDTQEKYYEIKRITPGAWEDWDEFENFLLEFDEQKVPNLREFKDFFYKYKAGNFHYTEYDFKEINVLDE